MFSSRSAHVRGMEIGGKAPVRIQTMYDRPFGAESVDDILRRIASLSAMGCDLIRFSFASKSDAPFFLEIASRSPIPVVADIHFDYRMAILAIESGADKIRINPGNIGAEWKTREIVKAALDHGTAIRIGLNSGSLPSGEGSIPSRMVSSALGYIDLFESMGFDNTVVSLKSSDGDETAEAARLFAGESGYPQHIGVTEAGDSVISAVRSTWALGRLLSSGIGDTIRISMTGSIEDEVAAAAELLRVAGLSEKGVRIVSCPRCGRHTFDTMGFLRENRGRLLALDKNITVAIMGCLVNGPGEAGYADYAITGYGDKVYIYRKGSLVMKTSAEDAASALFEVIDDE